MPDNHLTKEGEAEVFKGGVHLLLLCLSSMCLGYNAMAFTSRREVRLLVNLGVYAALTWFEGVQMLSHLRCALEEERESPKVEEGWDEITLDGSFVRGG